MDRVLQRSDQHQDTKGKKKGLVNALNSLHRVNVYPDALNWRGFSLVLEL